MAGAIDTQNKRVSIWHRWDPHIHTPGTALSNQYTGTDPWEAFLGAIEARTKHATAPTTIATPDDDLPF